jgi:hypothetical protein
MEFDTTKIIKGMSVCCHRATGKSGRLAFVKFSPSRRSLALPHNHENANKKRGIYIPARRYVSKTVAMFFTFFMSGLTHEYYSTLLSFHDDCDSATHNISTSATATTSGDETEAPKCFVPIYSKLLAFFAWNGIIVLLERPVSKTWICRTCAQWLPLPILSSLILLPVLPVGHWFVGEWIEGGFFDGLSLGFFRIVHLSSPTTTSE